MTSTMTTLDAAHALEHWTDIEGALRRSSDGLINDTFFVGDRFVLQRLHPVFRAEVNEDIAALTPVLARAGVPVPEIVPTAMDATCVTLHSGVWRVLTRLPGRTLHRVETPRQAFAAGEMLARFHSALRGARYDFRFSRPGAHDTDAHMVAMFDALRAHPGHRLGGEVRALAGEIELRRGGLEAIPIDDHSVDAAMMLIVLTYITEPAKALREMARIIKPGGRAVIVDLLHHDRDDFRRQMEQRHLGFTGEALTAMLTDVGFVNASHRELPPQKEARGPALVLITATRS